MLRTRPTRMDSRMSASPLIDRRHLDFALHELLDVTALTTYPRFAKHNRKTFDAVVKLAHTVALETFYPHARKSDLHEPVMVDGKVVLIPEIEAGVPAPSDAPVVLVEPVVDIGGHKLPVVSSKLVSGQVGVYEIKVTVPWTVPTGMSQTLQIRQGGYASSAQVRVID